MCHTFLEMLDRETKEFRVKGLFLPHVTEGECDKLLELLDDEVVNDLWERYDGSITLEFIYECRALARGLLREKQ